MCISHYCGFHFILQLRLHRTTHSTVCLHVTSKGVIEDCSDMHFAPYNFTYEGIEEHFKVCWLLHVLHTCVVDGYISDCSTAVGSGGPSERGQYLGQDRRLQLAILQCTLPSLECAARKPKNTCHRCHKWLITRLCVHLSSTSILFSIGEIIVTTAESVLKM